VTDNMQSIDRRRLAIETELRASLAGLFAERQLKCYRDDPPPSVFFSLRSTPSAPARGVGPAMV